MPFALLLALVATATGTIATYFYDRDAPMPARACAGVCTGFVALGLVGFILASFLGLTPLTLLLAVVIVAAPLALLLKSEWRTRLAVDIGDAWGFVRRALISGGDGGRGVVIFYASVAVLFWFLFGRVMYVSGGEVFTGAETNLGDLPFHISIITGFAFGDNFPPQHPEFSGVRLTYPFMIDFVAAMFVRAGASLEGVMFWQNFVLALALVGLLHRWAWRLTRDRLAALITPALVLLSGGLGWWVLVREWRAGSRSVFEMLWALSHDYTITSGETAYRWGNALTVLLIPQRGLLLGIPLALIVWMLWWRVVGDDVDGEDERGRSREDEKRGKGETGKRVKSGKSRRQRRGGDAEGRRRAAVDVASLPVPFSLSPFPRFSPSALMLAAGVVAGLLPLVHAHSFVVMMGMGGCLLLLFPKWWRAWAVFFVSALLIAAPQMWWATRESGARAGTFFGWEFGWDKGTQNVVWFWLKNTGLFIPLLVVALAWRGERPLTSKRLVLFWLPFALCFVIPNLYKLSPWVWDNIKVIFYWWLASAPLVALLLARVWRLRLKGWQAMAGRVAAVTLLLMLTLAGSLDVWRVVSEQAEQKIFDRDGVLLAELIKRETPPRSLILHAPTYNHPVFLTGRRSPMGYAGHLWTHGLDYLPREADLRRMYAGGAGAAELLERYAVDYVVVSPLEQTAMVVNSQFFERYAKVGEAGAYRLYKTTRP
ncbi:MAG TPA: hypothetical protein VF666_00120 [Pyrinomonadaceae bacterium]|jgi:hypothetical protein